MKTLVLVHLLMAALLASCGQESPNTSLEVVHGFALGPSEPGMLYLQRLDAPDKRAVKLTGSSYNTNLPNGKWRISLITWDNSDPDPMEGKPRCGTAEVGLTGGAVTVDLVYDKTKCSTGQWAAPGEGWQIVSGAVSFNGIRVRLCDDNSSLNSAACPTTSAAAGIRITLPGENGYMQSTCVAPSSGTFTTNVKLPFGTVSDFPVNTHVTVYYSAGCAGTGVTYRFPKGIGQGSTDAASGTVLATTNVVMMEEIPPSAQLALHNESWTGGPDYDTGGACQTFQIRNEDASQAPLTLPAGATVNLDCDGTCTFYSTSCGSPLSDVTTATIPANDSTTATVYFKPNKREFRLSYSATGAGAAGSLAVATKVDFPRLDGAYLFEDTLASIPGAVTWAPPFALGNLVAYETIVGGTVANRGVLEITSMDDAGATLPANGRLYFDYKTFNPSLALVASGISTQGEVSSQGPTDNCYVDLDADIDTFPGTLLGNSFDGDADFWWQDNSGTLVFTPATSTTFYLLPL